MTWLFRTPTVLEGPAGLDPLFHRVKIDRGITIIQDVQGGFTALRFPTQDEIAITGATVAVFMGGHEYEVSDATKNALIAGGVGVTESNFTLIS